MYKTKNKILILAIALISVALVAGGVSLMVRAFGSGSVERPASVALDENIFLNSASSEGAYVKDMEGEKYVFLNSNSKGDKIIVDTENFDFSAFLNSNHTKIIFGFDIKGLEGYAIPNMTIKPTFKNDGKDVNAELRDYGTSNIKIADSTYYTVTTAANTTDFYVFSDRFTIADTHRFSISFAKVEGIPQIQLITTIDEKTQSYLLTVDELFNIENIEISLTSPYSVESKLAAVQISNYELVYVPSLKAFDSEAIVIPQNASKTYNKNNINESFSLWHSDYSSVYYSGGETHVNIDESEKDVILGNMNHKLKLTDYDYVEFSFELKQYNDVNCPEFFFYLISRTEDGSALKALSNSTLYLKRDGEKIYILNKDKTHMTVPTSEAINIRYLIEVNKTAFEQSRLQIFVDNKLIYEHDNSKAALFASPYVCLTDCRFEAFDSSGAFYVKAATMSGYTLPTAS